MSFNSALAFVLAGLAVWLAERTGSPGSKAAWPGHLARLCAGLVVLLGLMALGESLCGWNLDGYRLIHGQLYELTRPLFRPLSFYAGLSFLLLGIAAFVSTSRQTCRPRLEQSLALAAGLLTVLALLQVAYQFRWSHLVRLDLSASAPTLSLFVLLATSQLCLHPERGLMAELTSHRFGSRIARRLLPLAVVIPFLVGWLVEAGEGAGWLGPGEDSAAFATLIILLFGLLIWFNAGIFNRLEAGRQQALETRLRLAAIVECSDEAIISTTKRGMINSWNRAAEQMYGYPAQEALGQPIALIVPPQASAELERLVNKLDRGERIPSFETVRQRKDGSLIHVALTLFPIVDATGHILGSASIGRDITEQRHLQTQVQEGQRLLKAVLGHIPDPAWLKDASGRFVACTEAFARLHGRTVDTVLGKTAIDILPGEGQRLTAEDGEVTRTGKSIRVEGALVDATGRKRWFETIKSPILNEQGEFAGTVGLAHEITERVHAEQALRAAQQQLRHLLSKSPAVIYSVRFRDEVPEIAWVSENSRDLLGYEAEEICQPDWWPTHVHPEDRDAAAAARTQILDRGQVASEYRIRRKDGTDCWLRDEQRLVRDPAGRPVEIVGSWVNVTERRQLESQLRQSQKLEAIGQLAGGVAHDFNNLLMVIRGNADLALMAKPPVDAGTRDLLAQVTAAADRAANLTRQLLAFSRRQFMQSQPLNLNDVIGNLTKMLKRIIGEHICLELNCTPGLPLVRADVGMLEQVLINLVVNARDAMPRGGSLTITTSKVLLEADAARAHAEAHAGRFVCLSVCDTGAGIAPEHLPHIFEPFFTTKEVGKGTGLGLATVHGIVKQHQGWIEVASHAGTGTTFKIYLPTIRAGAAPVASQPAEVQPQGGTETILLVEDDQAVRAFTRRVLAGYGYRVLEATSGQAALELWRRRSGEIALLLTDIVMPGELNGIELAQQLQAQAPALKVIFTSGYSAETAGQDKDSPVLARHILLQKPCPPRALLATVRRCLDADARAPAFTRAEPNRNGSGTAAR